MFKNGKNCTKDLHISNKSRTFADVFMNKLRFRFRTPCAVIARGALLYIWLKKLSNLRKINFFIKKKWKKFGSIKKKQYLCTVKQKKTTLQNYYNYENRNDNELQKLCRVLREPCKRVTHNDGGARICRVRMGIHMF